jgi:hypothetical protein
MVSLVAYMNREEGQIDCDVRPTRHSLYMEVEFVTVTVTMN